MKNKENTKQMLFEMLSKIDTTFQSNIIDEASQIGTTSAQSPIGSAPVQPTQPAMPNQPSDVKTLSRATQNASTVQSASKRINTATEFPEAFRVWFSGLGYKPENPAISIMKVKQVVGDMMMKMGFK